jgi:ribonucleoside-diphosphate reductase alpha chain
LLWHPEIENILVLKNNKGTPDNRVRKLDYSVIINSYLYQRLIDGKDISLFSPHMVPDLYDAYFSDPEEFKRLYEIYEEDDELVEGRMPAVELFSSLMMERKDTGRVYIMNVDNVNGHSAFVDPVRMSNLCLEITLLIALG